jgi:hypothetical protein
LDEGGGDEGGGPVDLSFNEPHFSQDGQRRRSTIIDEAVWRPLEYKRRQSAIVELSALREAELRRLQNSYGGGDASPTDSGGGVTSSPASSPTSPTLPHGGGMPSPMPDVIRCLLEATLPEHRRYVVLARLSQHIQEVNELHADTYRRALRVYTFDREEYKAKTKQGRATTHVPRHPQPRFRIAVVRAQLMKAMVMAEWEEHVMRSLDTTTAPMMSTGGGDVSAMVARRNRHIKFPQLSEGEKAAVGHFRAEERQVARQKKMIAAEQRRREELLREVEPAEFPAITRRDTMRLLIERVSDTTEVEA